LRIGHCFLPKCGYTILQTGIPEVMVITDVQENYLSKIDFSIKPQAIGIGPGIGQEPATQNALHDFLKSNTKPLVIDADAINILAKNPSWMHLLPPKTILTPHQKELERLIGTWENEAQIYENTTGNPALATAGSGDVLTGMITSFLAQGYQPIEAALLGVYLHGLTADIALPETGYQSFIASDIIRYIGKAFLSLEK
jgi:ADP-dependent NAD(P)H-hydrate dehydratase